jgi:hypothetical protein
MALALTSRRGRALNALLAVNGIHCESRAGEDVVRTVISELVW